MFSKLVHLANDGAVPWMNARGTLWTVDEGGASGDEACEVRNEDAAKVFQVKGKNVGGA